MFWLLKSANFKSTQGQESQRSRSIRGLYLFVCTVLQNLNSELVEVHVFYCTKSTMYKQIHIGALIRDKLKEEERSIAWFARKLHCDRTNIYKIFQKQHLDSELLLKISIVLNYNFFSHYSNLFDNDKNN